MGRHIEQVRGGGSATCSRPAVWLVRTAFVAGILSARRGSPPGNLSRVHTPDPTDFRRGPTWKWCHAERRPEELTTACRDDRRRPRVLNLSRAMLHSSRRTSTLWTVASTTRRGEVIVVAAAGNQRGAWQFGDHSPSPGLFRSRAVTFRADRCWNRTWGLSIGRRGLTAPGDEVISLGSLGQAADPAANSAATPFRRRGNRRSCGRSFRPRAPGEVKTAITRGGGQPQNKLLPPLLDAWTAFQVTASSRQARESDGRKWDY